MDKDGIREFAQRAIANADEGIRRAAAGVNEGVDQARDGLRKSAFANKLIKDIQNCIKELEKGNKAVTPGSAHDDTESLVAKLKNVVKIIKEDPYNCEAILDSMIEDFKNAIDYMLDNNTSPEQMLEMTVMTKNYNSAIRACQSAKGLIEEVREADEQAAAEKNAPQVVQLNDSEIMLLIPEGYEKAKYKNPARQLKQSLSKNEIALRKVTERSDNILVFMKTTAENAMDFDGKQAIIDGVHQQMADNQGLIEVEAGKTKRGYDYIYSIVKTIRDDFKGALYFLRMNVGTESEVIEIQATFEEIGMTGERDSFGYAMASNAGLVSHHDDGGFSGWNEDPYDPEYTKGIPMNLSERSGLDGLFPYHPLSQAREFLLAMIEDKFVLLRKEPDDEVAENVTSEEAEEKKDNQEMLANLFAKDPVYTRHTVDIEI